MTTPSGAEQARKTRRRRLHERQAVVFGLLSTVLVLVIVGGVLVFTGAVAMPFDRGFTSEADDSPYAGVKAPCVPPETMPAAVTDVAVTVLNASDRKGLAGAVADELENRGFANVQSGNAPATDDASRTQIRFGVGGIAQAYTAAAHFDNPQMLLDARAPENTTVDVVVGSDFENLVPADQTTLDASIPLQSPKDCVAIDKITPIPALPAPSAATDEQPAAG